MSLLVVLSAWKAVAVTVCVVPSVSLSRAQRGAVVHGTMRQEPAGPPSWQTVSWYLTQPERQGEKCAGLVNQS